MKTLLMIALCLCGGAALGADERPTIFSLAGREFLIDDDFAGQSLGFADRHGTLVAVWRILGSGVPVVSEVAYPVEIRSQWQTVFEVALRDQSRGRIKVEIYSPTEIRAYLNGLRITLEECARASTPPDSR